MVSFDMNTYQRNRRVRFKSLGICIHCCCRPATSGFSSCELCRTAIKSRMLVNRFADKPPKPDKCPLCGDGTGRFYWHHWDDNNLRLGVWLCPHCNTIVELEDRDLVQRYRRLKRKLT